MLYLCSSFKRSYHLIQSDGVDFSSLRIGAIWNAGDMYSSRDWIVDTQKLLASLSSDIVVIDLDTIDSVSFSLALDSIDLLYVNGGSARYLLHLLRQRGCELILKSFLERDESIYIGSSAGSLILCPDVAHCDFLESYQYPEYDSQGLGIVPFFLIPHGAKEKYRQKFVKGGADLLMHDMPLLVLDDNQIVTYDGVSFRFV